jgi:hypothetical protein
MMKTYGDLPERLLDKIYDTAADSTLWREVLLS